MTNHLDDAWRLHHALWQRNEYGAGVSHTPGPNSLCERLQHYIGSPTDENLERVRDGIDGVLPNDLGRIRRIAGPLANWPDGQMPADVAALYPNHKTGQR